jgi:hypothetical protein
MVYPLTTWAYDGLHDSTTRLDDRRPALHSVILALYGTVLALVLPVA